MTRPDHLVTRDQLVRDLRSLGVAEGQVVMIHVSIRAIGWIVGGPDQLIAALLDVLGSQGTLCMYISWEEWERSLVDTDGYTEEQLRVIGEHCPPFDPRTSRANREYSILAEYLRTYPGACRSDHPTASVGAIGAQAEWITRDHPLEYGYGYGSPWDKVCRLGGNILLLGSPLENVTLLHYAEHIARIPNKNVARNKVPLIKDGKRVWVAFDEFDTTWGIRDLPSEEYFATIVREYIASGAARRGTVGQAESFLMNAADLANQAVAWMERRWKQG